LLLHKKKGLYILCIEVLQKDEIKMAGVSLKVPLEDDQPLTGACVSGGRHNCSRQCPKPCPRHVCTPKCPRKCVWKCKRVCPPKEPYCPESLLKPCMRDVGLIPLLPAALFELIGTFILTLIGSGSAAAGFSPTGIAIAHGYALFFIISAIGVLSGAHVNPGVTVAFWLGGRISFLRGIAYIVAQYAGGIGAGALLLAFFPKAGGLGTPVLAAGFSVLQGIFVEGVFTFILVLVILHAAIAKTAKLPALTIGLTLGAIDLAVGTVTGGAVNHARAFGPTLFSGLWSHHYIYAIGAYGGALVAFFVFWVVDRFGYLKHMKN